MKGKGKGKEGVGREVKWRGGSDQEGSGRIGIGGEGSGVD